jgi:predicted enzyme related to lactoylglutathione lyase
MQATTELAWSELSAADLERALGFYESVLQQELWHETIGPCTRPPEPEAWRTIHEQA